ncbi:MAG: MBL fold metallo-hydrolase [Magnetococcales bacterium]|nr:MBL fold metallo-hydrolase [Magnetococcales bacterium]
MRVTILGSGTGLFSVERNAAGYWLRAAGESILIDCGSGTLRQLLKAGGDWRTLDRLFLTHTHVDHLGDLAPLFHALHYHLPDRVKPFTVYGPPGFGEFFARFIEPLSGMPEGFPCQAREATAEQWAGNLRILTQPTVHSKRMNSLAYRFEWGGKSVLFSGDSDYDPGLIAFAQGVDLLLLDASTLAENKFTGHMSAAECGRVAHQAGAGRLVLSHFYPIDGPDSRRLEECNRFYSGPVVLAEDFLTLEI